MTIYTAFISHTKLISPFTGYTCKRITKQNIKNFGFDSIEELHKQLPEFPLMCEEYYNKIKIGGLSEARKKTIEKSKILKLEEKKQKDKIEIKNYKLNPKNCLKCGNVIPIKIKHWSYCSRSCANSRNWSDSDKKKKSIAAKKHGNKTKNKKFQESLINVLCFCGKSYVKVSPKNYKNDKQYSCSDDKCKKKLFNINRRKAGRIGGKASAAKRVKRSKQEKELYELVKLHFNNIGHNNPIANGWDADILLYDYKIAIMWNGPWHYREMGFSNHSLKQVVNRDCIKIQEFENIGWKVIIYQDNQWNPQSSLIDILLKTKY